MRSARESDHLSSPLAARFTALGARLGFAANANTHWRDLVARYRESHRSYHSLQHIAECLAAFDGTRDSSADPDLVEFAIYAHDVVYDTHRSDSEQRSAEWAAAILRGAGASNARVEHVVQLILATTHAERATTPDAAVVCDADLWILGAPPARFDEYERQVREEYAWVPEPIFRARRAEILESFLARGTIYATARYIETLEADARSNLRRSLAALRGAGPPG